MTRSKWPITQSLMAVVALTSSLVAQQTAQQVTPHAGYVYPAGGRQGTSFDVAVGGQFLNGANNAYVSGSGVQISVADYTRPLTPAQTNTLRNQLKTLMGKRAGGQQGTAQGDTEAAKTAWTSEDQKTAIEIRQKLAEFLRRRANPAIAEIVTLHITIAPDAAYGQRELRVAAAAGLTNPLAFWVGQLPEFSRDPAKAVVPQGPLRSAAGENQFFNNSASGPTVDITLPTIVNGQIMPGAVDRYRFAARQGQHLVIAVRARELMPYVADAVPGWFQAALTLHDPDGKEVAYADHYLFHPDPVIYYEVPRDGEYVLDIRDSIYRGRDDFVYRVSIGELPFVTGIFPLGGKAGSKTTVGLLGWNLAVSKITENSKGKDRGVEMISAHSKEWVSNSVPFALDILPEIREKEPNDQPENAQVIKIPIVIDGRVEQPGDWDVFRFTGRAGDQIVAEVFARRLNSPLDSLLKLLDATGKELASNDDYVDKGSGLLTHQADSRIDFKLPANGIYYLRLGDAQGNGGMDYAYRLRLSHPHPDFKLCIVPSSINIRANASTPITVHVLRQDGFAGDIELKLKDAPAGFHLDGAVIPGNEEKVRLTLTAPQGRNETPVRISLEGAALIRGQTIRRLAIATEDMMQAFFYRHLVPAQELLVSVVGPGRPGARWKSLGADRLKLPAGGTAQLQLLASPRLKDQVQLALDSPPDGLSIQNVSPNADGVTIVLHAEAGKAKLGDRGNLILNAFIERDVTAAGQTVRRRLPMGALPAIPFEVVGRTETR